MWNLRTIVAATGLALSLGAAANVPAETVPSVYIEGGQYTAVLNQRTQAWRLLPGDGLDLAVSAAESGCQAGGHLPAGIWLVTSDAQGHAVLAAPSFTELPAGHPAQVALRACGTPADGQPFVAAPQGLIDWLTYNTGAIYVED
jgi:hypothetical protein